MTLVARHSALSDIGFRRKTNEDAFVVAPPLFAVCDGMGGAQAGEVASSVAAETLAAGVANGLSLLAAAQEANAAVFASASDDSAHAGMGTTLTAVLLDDDRGYFAHVGDSRAYLLRDGELTQLSDDHSLVAEMARDGRLTEQEAAAHPQRSILSRALGTEASVHLDEFAVDLRAGDVLLLCSDGLSGPVPAPAIARALSLEDTDEAVAKLIDEARWRGGPDNITALVLRLDERLAVDAGLAGQDCGSTGQPVNDADGASSVEADLAQLSMDPTEDVGKSSRRRLGCLVVILALLVVAGIIGVVILGTVFYVSVYDDRVAVFSGLPVEVGPVPLHAVYRSSSQMYSSLSGPQKTLVDECSLRSKSSALEFAHDLEMRP